MAVGAKKITPRPNRAIAEIPVVDLDFGTFRYVFRRDLNQIICLLPPLGGQRSSRDSRQNVARVALFATEELFGVIVRSELVPGNWTAGKVYVSPSTCRR